MTKTYRTTKIQWTQHTWNPIRGCTPVSEGCINCYARRMTAWRFKDKEFKPRIIWNKIEEPLKWKKPRMVFVGSMGDIFHEDLSAKDIIHIFEIMQHCKDHTFHVLTKRPKRMLDVLFGEKGNWYLGGGDYIPNVWMGITAENQEMFDYRKSLLSEWRGIKYVSFEPLLGPIKFNTYSLQTDHCFICELEDKAVQKRGTQSHPINCQHNRTFIKPPKKYGPTYHGIDWVIVGGETGPNARWCREEWVKGIYDQCQESGVPFFFKQEGKFWLPNRDNTDIDWKHRREWPRCREVG